MFISQTLCTLHELLYIISRISLFAVYQMHGMWLGLLFAAVAVAGAHLLLLDLVLAVAFCYPKSGLLFCIHSASLDSAIALFIIEFIVYGVASYTNMKQVDKNETENQLLYVANVRICHVIIVIVISILFHLCSCCVSAQLLFDTRTQKCVCSINGESFSRIHPCIKTIFQWNYCKWMH